MDLGELLATKVFFAFAHCAVRNRTASSTNDSPTIFTVRCISYPLFVSPRTDNGLPFHAIGYLDGTLSSRIRTGQQLTHPAAPFATTACIRANRSPNPLQVLRLLDYADVVLADVPFDLGWLLNIVVGKSSSRPFPSSVPS